MAVGMALAGRSFTVSAAIQGSSVQVLVTADVPQIRIVAHDALRATWRRDMYDASGQDGGAGEVRSVQERGDE